MIGIYISIGLILLGVAIRFSDFPYLSYIIVDFYQSTHMAKNTKEDKFDLDKMNHYLGFSIIIMGIVLLVGSFMEIILLPDAGTISSIFVGILLVDLLAAPKRYEKNQPRTERALMFHWALLVLLGIAFYFSYRM